MMWDSHVSNASRSRLPFVEPTINSWLGETVPCKMHAAIPSVLGDESLDVLYRVHHGAVTE